MRPAWRYAAALAVVGVLVLPRAAMAVGTGGCTAEGHSTSSSVDITTGTEWHLRSTDVAGGSGTSPVKMTAAQVYAYALGIEIPIASGTGDGGTSGAVDRVSVAPFAVLGHRFTVAGSASGDGSCSGSIAVVLDDVNPMLTVLGGGGIALLVVGGLGVFAGAQSRGGALRRVVAGVFGAFGGAGLGLALEQFGVTDPTSPVGLVLVLLGLLLGLLLAGILRRGGAVVAVNESAPAPAAGLGAAVVAQTPTVPEPGSDGHQAMQRGLLPNLHQPNLGGDPIPVPWQVSPTDPNHAFNPQSGQNAVWDPQKLQWFDGKTGEPIGASGAAPGK